MSSKKILEGLLDEVSVKDLGGDMYQIGNTGITSKQGLEEFDKAMRERLYNGILTQEEEDTYNPLKINDNGNEKETD
jgi:hypothetical protein